MIEEGIEEGIKKGAKRKSIEIAKNMLKKGMDINTITEVTGFKIHLLYTSPVRFLKDIFMEIFICYT